MSGSSSLRESRIAMLRGVRAFMYVTVAASEKLVSAWVS